MGEQPLDINLKGEVDAVAMFYIHWTLVCTQIPKKSFATQERLCQSHKADALESFNMVAHMSTTHIHSGLHSLRVPLLSASGIYLPQNIKESKLLKQAHVSCQMCEHLK